MKRNWLKNKDIILRWIICININLITFLKRSHIRIELFSSLLHLKEKFIKYSLLYYCFSKWCLLVTHIFSFLFFFITLKVYSYTNSLLIFCFLLKKWHYFSTFFLSSQISTKALWEKCVSTVVYRCKFLTTTYFLL